MAQADTNIDFSAEDWDEAVEFFDASWVIAHKHNPGLVTNMELNNRTFVFRLDNATSGQTELMVFGCADAPAVEAVKALASKTELPVAWVVGNGGAHHMFLRLWYEAFPEARVLVPAKRIPTTRNGQKLAKEFADRWELLEGPKHAELTAAFGDQIDLAIFDQLFSYADQDANKVLKGAAADHTSERSKTGGFSFMKGLMTLLKKMEQPTDEVFLFHRASGLCIGAHNFQFTYVPRDYKPPKHHQTKAGPFPLGIMMKMMMPKGAFKSTLEGQPQPIADSAKHLETWEKVLGWDMRAWTSCHDPVRVCGPDMSGDEIKQAIRESLARSGEDDPTGARLKWNIKNRRPR